MPDRVALITGAAKRVGKAIAKRLHADGFQIAFTYHSSDAEAHQLAKELDALAIRADLTDPAVAIPSMIQTFAGRFNRLDVLVNNASWFAKANLSQATLELSQKLHNIHVASPMLLAQFFESHLRASKGHVINMVDLLAEKPWPEYLPYCASKAALGNLTLSLARSLAPEVTVNGIAPGVVEWPEDYPESEREKYLKRVPLARPGTPEDVANLVHFLVTTGTYITGQIIKLDGGRSLT